MASPDFEPEKGPDSDKHSQDSKPLDTEKVEEYAGDVRPVEPLDEPTSGYPHGTRLAIIIGSLMLSTFMIALDNVSDCASTKITQANSLLARLLLPRQFRKSQTSSMVLTRCCGMARHTS